MAVRTLGSSFSLALAGAGMLVLAFLLGGAAEGGGATMKAVRLHAYGGAENLKYEDAPAPVAGAGQLVVKVMAAGVNPVDWKIRSGAFAGGRAITTPLVLGYDVSGVVESVGEGVTKFKVGDEVFAYLSLQRGGGYSEQALVLETEAALRPKSVDHAHSAAVPLAALTAWQALVETAKLEKGQTVLVHAGAGGVGHFAVQIAKARGARVIATASESNLAFLKELGADVVIDYRAQKFEDVAKDVDVVLDPMGGDTQERSIGVVKPGGFLVSIVQPPSPEKLKARGINGRVILVRPDGQQLAELAKMIDAGQIKPHVSAELPLRDAAKAQEMSATGRTRGKIVLRP